MLLILFMSQILGNASKYGAFDFIIDLVKRSQVASVMGVQFYWKKMVKNV